MLRRSHHTAQRDAQPCRNQEDGDHLHQVGQRRGVLKRMRRVRIEEAAAVGAQHLDRLLRGHRPLRRSSASSTPSSTGLPSVPVVVTCLLLHQRGRVVRLEVLDHALATPAPAHRPGTWAAAPIACRASGPPRSCPASSSRAAQMPRINAIAKRHAHRGRPEVVRRQPEHLRQVAHRLLRHVGLPVGVGGKRCRRVPREVRLNRREVLRVP